MALTQKLDDISTRMKGYYEYLPDGYDPAKAYPLFVFLHGQGELGQGDAASLAKLANNAPIKYLKDGRLKFPGIVIAPQVIAWPQTYDVDAVLKWARGRYKIDEDRKYLGGLSMGGGACWNVLADPTVGKEFAAAIIVCGAERPTNAKATAIANNKVAVWGFHNQGDTTVVPSNTIQWVDWINNAKGEARKTIWPGGGHDSWTKAFDPAYTEGGENWMQFLLRHARNGVVVPPVEPPKPEPVPPVITIGKVNTIIVFPYPVSLIAQVKGTAPTFLWEQVSGPPAIIDNRTSVETQASCPSVGSYVFKLTATDNGAVSTDTLTYNIV